MVYSHGSPRRRHRDRRREVRRHYLHPARAVAGVGERRPAVDTTAGVDLSRWIRLRNLAGPLALSPAQMEKTAKATEMRGSTAGQFGSIQQSLSTPQTSRSPVRKADLPAADADAADDRLQRRWRLCTALLVARIGIAIVMLMSVTERVREISTMKRQIALGGFIIRLAWRDPPVGRLVGSAAVCFVVGLVLTIGAALYPAWRAARLQPIAAMRADV